MESPITRKTARSTSFWIEFLFLCALILTLPSLEAPKNIFWVAYVAAWLYSRFKTKQFGGAWDTWDTLIAVWIASGYIMAPFAGFHHSEWGGANDILRYGSILWLIKRSGYGRSELRWMLVTIIISTALALTEGLWQLFITHRHEALQLNSVGHVNHSAIYLAISYGVALSLTLAYWNSQRFFHKILSAAATVFFGVGIFISDSRAAVGMALVLTIVIGISWLRKSRKPLLILTTLAALIVSAAYIGQASVIKKHENDVRENNILSYRTLIWNVAAVAWEKYPIFGVGMHNFGKINVDHVKKWRDEAGKPFVPSEYLGAAHAHSLYMNTLAERGLFGTSILLAVLFSWAYWLFRFRPDNQSENLAWALWGGALSAWVITVGIGYANTTLHHEHAILSVTLLGMWLRYLTQANTPKSAP